MRDLIQKLTATFGPAGSEQKIRLLIEEEAKKYCDEIFIDPLGNLVAIKKSPAAKKDILLAAHMDEIGFMVTFIDEKGFLRFTNIGGLLLNTLVGSKVIFSNGTVGVIGQEKLKQRKDLALNKLYIDIGAKDRDEALKMVRIGDTAAFFASFHQNGDRIVAKSLDNRVGCAVLLETLKKVPDSLPNNLYFVFTVQEEVGLRGAGPIAYRLKPDYGIAVDVTRVGDTPKPEFKMEVSLGKGPAIKIKDSSIICHPEVTGRMIEIAEKNKIPYQLEILERGGTDAGAIHLSREGVPAGVLSIPCRYVHTPAEIVDLKDIENGITLLLEILKDKWP
ncbi:MAG: M42 family metallopeptidase [Dethiobacteria bacterium]|jgi:putative aminopeptidase FrvX